MFTLVHIVLPTADDMYSESSAVVVLSFARYCRYRGIVKRLEGVANKWLRNSLVIALGGFAVPCRNTRILFCKDTFDYPDLEGHELLCNHLGKILHNHFINIYMTNNSSL